MNITVEKNDLIIKDTDIKLDLTFDCGQCFRWDKIGDNTYSGFAFGKELTLVQNGSTVIFKNTGVDEFNNLWRNYFDFDTDYAEIVNTLSADETLKKACEYAFGIHILRQEPWEVICSFIISQNNNIKRIKGIIKRLCEMLGEQISETAYSFPTAEKIAACEPEQLAPLRAGFRAKYIVDAARKVAEGQIDIDSLYMLPLEQARQELMKINGVGPKVADCALLFGFYRTEAFPKDVWIRRALDYFYKDGFPEFAKSVGGIAQQYIFHYIRTCEDAIPAEYRKQKPSKKA